MEVKGDGSSDGYLQLNCSQNSHGIKLKSPPHSANQNYTLTFPSNIVNGQFLTTDANGNLSWAAVVTDLVNDTSPQLGGSLDVNGNNISFVDSTGTSNNRATFGASNDLQIYHSSDQNYVAATGTGNLNLISSGAVVAKVNSSEDAIVCNANGSVDLYHDNTKTVETHASGLTFNQGSGNLIKYGSTSEFPNAAINIKRSGNGYANIRLSSNYGCGLFMAGANDNTDEFGINQDNQKIGYLDNRGGAIKITTGSSGLTRLTFEDSYTITSVCDFVPSATNAKDLGTSSLRWRNIYTNDLNLSNEGGANDVDGTWGSYTIQEGADDLFLINKRNGKKYKFNLTEVN